jgi:ribosome recycling factor
MNSKEEREKPLKVDLLSNSFETAARILSSLKIEHIDLSPGVLKKLLSETFPDLPEEQIQELVKIFSKEGENNHERIEQ